MNIKKFLKRTALFVLLPLFILSITEAYILPPNFFTYRVWEAIVYKNPVPHLGSFYPNTHIKMDEQGDLAARTRYAVVKKNIEWSIDELGFRNDSFVEDQDLLLIGDSFTAGLTLNQDETITRRVKVLLGGKAKVYNIAPASFGDFAFLYQNKFLAKPKVVIFSLVERNLPDAFSLQQDAIDRKLKLSRVVSKTFDFRQLNKNIDRLLAFNSLKWAAAKVNKTRIGYQSPFDSTLFFMKGKEVKIFTLKEAEQTAKKIIGYKKYCDDAGIQFLFLPMPNKETVYYDMVPLRQQPQFLLQLDSILRGAGVETINSLGIYNSIKGQAGMLYQPDDTHWNEKATTIFAKEIVAHPLLQRVFGKE